MLPKDDDKEPVSIMTRFFRACLLMLAGVIALWLALQLLAKVWLWLLLIAAIAGLVWGVVWFFRWRRDRQW
jgi:putative flippase GtrA